MQQILEARQYIAVRDRTAGDELPIVETHAVVEQHFDIVDYQCAAMLVGRVFQFAADVLQTIDDRVALLFREMQRFVHLIGEEGVSVHVASERGAVQQVGMEQQRPPFGLELHAAVVDADTLSGGQTHERSLLVVVGAAAVADVAAFHLFEKNGVESEAVAHVFDGAALREIDDVHQRVRCRDVQQVVVLTDMVQFDDGLHKRVFLQK